MKSDAKKEENAMNEPAAAGLARRLTAETAASALPGAPVRPAPTARRRPLTAPLRRRSARLLVGLAVRLDPNPQTAN